MTKQVKIKNTRFGDLFINFESVRLKIENKQLPANLYRYLMDGELSVDLDLDNMVAKLSKSKTFKQKHSAKKLTDLIFNNKMTSVKNSVERFGIDGHPTLLGINLPTRFVINEETVPIEEVLQDTIMFLAETIKRRNIIIPDGECYTAGISVEIDGRFYWAITSGKAPYPTLYLYQMEKTND